MNEQIKVYLKDHWISMAFSLASSSFIFIIAFINLYTNFRVDNAALKQSVEANRESNNKSAQQYSQLLQNSIQMNNKITQLDQKITDEHEAIADIHRWFFGKSDR